MSVHFEDNSIRVKEALNEAIIAYLHEAAGEVEAQVKRNPRVDTGETKGSWTYRVDEGKKEATIGSGLENAIWEEFGTGEYAAEGNGRKGGWVYTDRHGETHFTRGKTPTRAFSSAFESTKPKIIKRAQQVIGGKMK